MTAKKTAPARASTAATKPKPAKPATKSPALTKATAKPNAKAEDLKGKRGRKPEVDAGKARALVEEDFSDLEADIEGEPEVDAAAEGDAKTKVKPLRMKVSRAKERALMREFGLEETALTEEEATKRRDRKSTRLNSSHLRLSRMPSSA